MQVDLPAAFTQRTFAITSSSPLVQHAVHAKLMKQQNLEHHIHHVDLFIVSGLCLLTHRSPPV